jgi:hypothetical protein
VGSGVGRGVGFGVGLGVGFGVVEGVTAGVGLGDATFALGPQAAARTATASAAVARPRIRATVVECIESTSFIVTARRGGSSPVADPASDGRGRDDPTVRLTTIPANSPIVPEVPRAHT